MKSLLVLSAAALLLPVACGGGGGSSSRSDGGRPITGPVTCDMKTIVKGDWCATCGTFCGEACPVDAAGKCKRCGNMTSKRDACLRTYWRCTECKASHDKVCNLNDSYQCCTKVESKSQLVCGGCGKECSDANCAECKKRGACKVRCLHQ